MLRMPLHRSPPTKGGRGSGRRGWLLPWPSKQVNRPRPCSTHGAPGTRCHLRVTQQVPPWLGLPRGTVFCFVSACAGGESTGTVRHLPITVSHGDLLPPPHVMTCKLHGNTATGRVQSHGTKLQQGLPGVRVTTSGHILNLPPIPRTSARHPTRQTCSRRAGGGHARQEQRSCGQMWWVHSCLPFVINVSYREVIPLDRACACRGCRI